MLVDLNARVGLPAFGNPVADSAAAAAIFFLRLGKPRRFDSASERLGRFDMRNHMPQGRRIAIVHEIHPAKLDGIHVQALGDDIHVALGGKHALKMPRSAHVTCRHRVGVDIFFFDQAVGHPIGSRRVMGTDQIALRAVGTVGAAVENKFDMLGDHQAIFLDAGLDLDHRAMARITRHQLLGIVDQQLDRPAGLLSQRVAKRDIVAVALAAEIAADVAGMHDQTRRRDLQSVTDLIAHIERAFVRRPHFRRAVGIDTHQ